MDKVKRTDEEAILIHKLIAENKVCWEDISDNIMWAIQKILRDEVNYGVYDGHGYLRAFADLLWKLDSEKDNNINS